MEIEKIIYLSIGTNQGDRLANLKNAINMIAERVGSVILISSVYENPPLGFESDEQFFNLCISVSTILKLESVLQVTQSIEQEMGRQRNENQNGYTNRIIDIDLIMVEDTCIQTSDLIIPHPRFRERKFVLVPLQEIAAELIDPISEISIKRLLSICQDSSFLTKIGALCLN